MTLPVYATRRDPYRYGALPRGALTNEGRFAIASTSTDRFELSEHGFETDDEITVRAIEGGSLPAPLLEGTTYYAIRAGSSTFQIAATAGGAAIDLTTAGASFLVMTPLPIDALLEFYSRWVEDVNPHLLPLTAPYPVLVVGVVARLAGKAVLNADGKTSALVAEAELAAKAQLERWAAGKGLKDTAATGSSNLAVSGADFVDAGGYGSGSLP